MIEWNRLTNKGFESLCYDILVKEGYGDLSLIGRAGGDRGRDIIAEKTMKIAESKELPYKCVVQCKKYLKRPPGPSDLSDTLAWAEAHNPDILLIMVSNTLTPGTYDWLDKIKSQKKYTIVVYEEKNFEQFFDKYKDVYQKHFGKERVPPKKVIISSLLDEGHKSLETIANETQLSKEEVREIMDELQRVNLVSREELPGVTSYYLERTITAFVNIAKQFLTDEKKFEFLTSQYSKSMIDSELINHIESQYHLVLSEDHKTALIKLFKISPLALNSALFSPTDIYETGYAHIQKLKPDAKQRNELSKSFLTSFMSMLLENALIDLRDSDAKKTLVENKVEGYNIGIKIKMASSKTPVLNLQSDMTIIWLRAAGSIKAGQLVSPTDPDVFIRTGGILLHLGLFDLAIQNYDRAISGVKDKKKLAAAWNNKGVCLMRLERTDQAILCFENALEIEPTLKEARENKQKCLTQIRNEKVQFSAC